MKQSRLLSLAMCLLVGSTALAQAPSHEQYVKEAPEETTWFDAYRSWAPGTPLYSGYEDEEFFISRVKPKERFTNAETQVDVDMSSDRKLLWWCPIGTSGWNAVPNYYFDSEAFSMWSYVDIYGNWTASMIRMSGAFSDICHKNGVKTSVLASVPWAATVTATDGGHGSNMKAMIDGGSEKLLKFLRYYGIDGIGYNSEFNIGDGLSAGELKTLLSDCFKNREAAKWPIFTNAWYSLMSNAGRVGGTDHLSSVNQDWFQFNSHPTSDAYFMNYNWGSSGLGISQETAEKFGRSSYDVYGGMDFQGRSVADWVALKNYKISVGLWGAHDMNMIFEGRGERGASNVQKQKTYQLMSENVFTGSSHNPVNTPEITNLLAHSSLQKNFHGFSSFITARSALTTTDLGKEPFVTYFNLGNGMFFNVKGKTEFPNQWYNIGVQDYLPTWRWWWSTSFMGRTPESVPAKGLTAEFTWDDAWFGGSSLAISGQTATEYLQLFKTKYPLVTGDKLLIRYKVVSGTGSLKWACSAEGAESTEVGATIDTKLSGTDEIWIEKVVSVGNGRSNLKLVDKNMAMMGLRFEDTSADFKILIGEISLTRNSMAVPHSPTITKQMMLSSNYLGVDFKVIFKMKDRSITNPEEPIYNSDVNTWYYKVYAQQEGEEATMTTATTSWAAYVVSTPYNTKGTKKMRVGVSAVSLDGMSESAIAWSNYENIPESTVVEGIEINKSVIKANEEFTVRYTDPTHSTATWEILNAQTGETVVDPVVDEVNITTSLPNVGIYDLKLTNDGKEAIYQGMIQISGTEVGALPQINSLKANGSEEPVSVKANDPVEFSYIGRPSDGMVSRGLLLSEKAFGIPCEQLNFTGTTPWSLSFWFNPVRFNHASSGTQLLNVRSASEEWPASDWGYIWSTISTDNKYSITFRKQENEGTEIAVDDFVFGANKWYHFALVVDYQSGRLMTLYINGRKIKTSPLITNLYAWTNSNVIMIGGKAFSRAGFDGYLDEFQLYNKALSESEVLKSMEHQTTIPDGLIGYWDFETDPKEDGYIYSTGTNTALKAGTVEAKTIDKGNNQYVPVPSNFATGAPFIPGTNYMITTTPSWNSGKNETISNVEGNGEAGKANITYSKDGTYTATLTLTNGWGADSKTFNYVTVGTGGVGIQDNELDAAYNAYPNPFVSEVNVRFENEGAYDIEIFDISGRMISAQKTTVNAGEYVNLNVNGSAGTYFITIKQGGKVLKALKVIKK